MIPKCIKLLTPKTLELGTQVIPKISLILEYAFLTNQCNDVEKTGNLSINISQGGSVEEQKQS